MCSIMKFSFCVKATVNLETQIAQNIEAISTAAVNCQDHP